MQSNGSYEKGGKNSSRDFWHDLSARICVEEFDIGHSLVQSNWSHSGQRAGARAPPGVYVCMPLVWEDIVWQQTPLGIIVYTSAWTLTLLAIRMASWCGQIWRKWQVPQSGSATGPPPSWPKVRHGFLRDFPTGDLRVHEWQERLTLIHHSFTSSRFVMENRDWSS